MMQDDSSILYVYRKYQDERRDKEDYKERLDRLEKRYINLNHAFNLHIDICRTHRDVEDESEWLKGVSNGYN